MRKLFSLFVALFAAINLWSYDFQYGDLYYKFGNAEGIEIPDTIGWNIPAECLTVAQAREICAALENGATTGTKYYVKGWVKKLSTRHEEGVKSFNNADFFIEDVKGANSQEDFWAFQVYGPNGSKITSLDQVLVGDYVVLYGELTNFNGTYETVGKGAAYICKSSNPALGGNGNTGNFPTDVVGAGTFENPYTANDVILLANSKAGNYWVKAYIVGQINGKSISGAEFDAPFSGSSNDDGSVNNYNTNILIANSADETNSGNCVPVQLPNGALRTGLNLVQNPDLDGVEVLIYGSLGAYFGAAGVKAPQYAKVGYKEFGTKPVETTGEELLYETLLTQASFDKFTTISVSGEQVWTYDAKYGATMSGYANAATIPNEDWFISPAMDLSSVNAATLTFNHAFGPAASVPNTDATKAQYTIWVSNDFDKDVKAATWTELKGMVYGTMGWSYVSSGNIAIPAENLKANCRIAWKYVCDDVSATWEIKEIIVKPVATNAVKQKSILEVPPTSANDKYVIVTRQTIDENNYNALTEVAIPATVEYNGITYVVSGIDDYAFAQAENLQSITILENIKAIGNCAFANCYNLQSITFTSEEPPHIFYKTFDNMYSDVQIYVPCGTVSAYQSAGIYNAQEPPAEYNIYLSTEVGGNARIDYNTLCGARISANPDFGYYFVQWSDGNTDNPRDLELTQDTILTAEFAQTISGKCGENLYWSYNESDQSISITGSGEMYNYTSGTQPWLLFKEQIKMLTTSNTTTSIGESAFAGAIRLADVHLGSNIETIAENAFAECNRLYHIYCYPTYPPFAKQSSFANYNIYLHVPCDYKEGYDLDIVWGNFKYIECMGAESEPINPDTVIVIPGTNDVTITWPTEENAYHYTIEIKKDGVVFCTLTFNADGQLLNIAFAPSRDGNNRPALYAEQVINGGLRFTVTGLEEGTNYSYDVITTDQQNQEISTHSGEFTTKGGTTTDLSNHSTTQKEAGLNTQKLLRDGQLLILRDGKTYNVMGAEIQ